MDKLKFFTIGFVVSLLLLDMAKAQARAGPIPTQTKTPTSTATATVTTPPSLTPSPTATKTKPPETIPTQVPLDPDSSPTPTSTAVPPILGFIGDELVDLFRIERIFDCGSAANECLRKESDALILARIAMGETPGNFQDRVYVMWNIKMRAVLGFKEAGHYSGYRSMEARWGPETSIKTEALCDGGCQYSPARVAEGVYYPCTLSEGHPIRAMMCPTDEQLVDFYLTFLIAQEIVDAPIDEMPEELRGYDSFRSPTIAGVGRKHRDGGLPSRQFFPRANVWQDEYDKDNYFWLTLTGGDVDIQ